MADRARDGGKAKAQGPLQLIDLVVNIRDLDPGIHHAVEIHDLAGVSFAHPHVVNLADQVDVGGNLGERVVDCRDALRRRLSPMLAMRLHRLDVRFDFDVRSQFLADGFLQSAGDVMRGSEGETAVDLEIKRDREPSRDGD